MPRGPRGEKRPANEISAAVMVAKIATGGDSRSPVMAVGLTDKLMADIVRMIDAYE